MKNKQYESIRNQPYVHNTKYIRFYKRYKKCWYEHEYLDFNTSIELTYLNIKYKTYNITLSIFNKGTKYPRFHGNEKIDDFIGYKIVNNRKKKCIERYEGRGKYIIVNKDMTIINVNRKDIELVLTQPLRMGIDEVKDIVDIILDYTLYNRNIPLSERLRFYR